MQEGDPAISGAAFTLHLARTNYGHLPGSEKDSDMESALEGLYYSIFALMYKFRENVIFNLSQLHSRRTLPLLQINDGENYTFVSSTTNS